MFPAKHIAMFTDLENRLGAAMDEVKDALCANVKLTREELHFLSMGIIIVKALTFEYADMEDFMKTEQRTGD